MHHITDCTNSRCPYCRSPALQCVIHTSVVAEAAHLAPHFAQTVYYRYAVLIIIEPGKGNRPGLKYPIGTLVPEKLPVKHSLALLATD